MNMIDQDKIEIKKPKVHFISCGVFQPELDYVLDQIKQDKLFDCEITVNYLNAGLHTNFNLLKNNILKALEQDKGSRTILLYGSKCHPDFDGLLKDYPLIRFPEPNCIELILEEEFRKRFKDTRICLLTTGWITKWREFFDSRGMLTEEDLQKRDVNWEPDTFSIRQNFGWYDELLLANTGVCDITDEQMIEFFELTGVPLDVEFVRLEYFKESIVNAIKEIEGTQNKEEETRNEVVI